MPCYPALALLLGSAMAAGATGFGTVRASCAAYSSLAAAAVLTLYFCRGISPRRAIFPPRSDRILVPTNFRSVTWKTSPSLPLPTCGSRCFSRRRRFSWERPGRSAPRAAAFLPTALMAILFFQAARIAMAAFDPYLSSRPLAEALLPCAPGEAHRRPPLLHFFFCVLLYKSGGCLLLNGRFNNLVYGSYAPGAPECLCRRCTDGRHSGCTGSLLPRDHPKSRRAPEELSWNLNCSPSFPKAEASCFSRTIRYPDNHAAHQRDFPRNRGNTIHLLRSLSIYSSWRYFRQPASAPDPVFPPPVSILKPFRGSIRTPGRTSPVFAVWIIPSMKLFSA